MSNGQSTETGTRKNLHLIGQWVAIAIAVIAGWLALDRQVTLNKAGIEYLDRRITQEQLGYNQMLVTINQRLEKMDNKIDTLIGKAHTHGGNQ